jgi:hypothetical protein
LHHETSEEAEMWDLRLGALGLAASALAVGAVLSFGYSGQEEEPNLRYIMQRKLDNAHSVLEALIAEDFETLEDSASVLRALSEEASWFVLETSEYTERSTAFRRAASEIEQAAKEKDTHRAALGYVDMTLQCVRCHQLLRGTRRAGLGPR